MDFYEVVDKVVDLLKQRGRASYRALSLQFKLNDEHLEVLKEELIDVQQLAVDQDGRMLVWSGERTSSPEPTPTPSTSVASEPASSPDTGPEPLSYTPPHLAEKILQSKISFRRRKKKCECSFL